MKKGFISENLFLTGSGTKLIHFGTKVMRNYKYSRVSTGTPRFLWLTSQMMDYASANGRKCSARNTD